MKTASTFETSRARPIPRGWKILGLAVASWICLLVVGSGLVNLFHIIANAV